MRITEPLSNSQSPRRAHRPSALVFLLAIVAPIGVASAATVNQVVKSTASVENTCLIQSANNLSFGTYVPYINGTVQTSGVLSLTCTKNAVAQVAPVTGGSSLVGAGGRLSYAIYADSTLSKQWGSPVPMFTSVDFSAYIINFSGSRSGITLAQCSALSNNTPFAYLPSFDPSYGTPTGSGTCFTGYNPSGTKVVFGVTQPFPYFYNSGLVVGGVTIVPTGHYENQGHPASGTIYAPSGTLVSGKTYSVPTSFSGAIALTKTSLGAHTPIHLTYYASLPGGQDVGPGAYLDTVVFQVSF